MPGMPPFGTESCNRILLTIHQRHAIVRATRSMPMINRLQRLRQDYEIAAERLYLEFITLSSFQIKAGYRQDEPRDSRGRWTKIDGNLIVTRNDRTGNRKIDSTSDIIIDVASDIIKENGPGSGQLYGVMIHRQFARDIRQLDLPGIGTFGLEQSFSAGDTVRYGLDGSIRTDVILRAGRTVYSPILAVWDLKTGGARLRPKRVSEIRNALGIDESVPIIELHVERGLSIKSFVWYY